MSAVHRTTGSANDCGFQSRVNEAMDALRTFHSAAKGVEQVFNSTNVDLGITDHIVPSPQGSQLESMFTLPSIQPESSLKTRYSIVQPIAVMPPSRMRKPTFAMPRIKVLSRHGIEDFYSPDAQRKTPIQLTIWCY
ncbi:hypothetical protein TNCV_4159301 [Trichonephila clavipes]|nr:hypothetical protein TNCV_4159301 [Trichonephila clavipes]